MPRLDEAKKLIEQVAAGTEPRSLITEGGGGDVLASAAKDAFKSVEDVEDDIVALAVSCEKAERDNSHLNWSYAKNMCYQSMDMLKRISKLMAGAQKWIDQNKSNIR